MSLHDKYFSDTNKRHMFSMITDLVLKETGRDLQTDLSLRNMYDSRYPTVFGQVDTDSIVELNKALVDYVCPPLILACQAQTLTQQSLTQQSLMTKTKTMTKPSILKQPPVLERDPLSIYSDDRLPTSKNRYHYQISLVDRDRDRDYVHLHKIIIPDEPNPLFGIPTIRVKINDKIIVCEHEETKCLGDRDYVSYVPEGYAKRLQIPMSREEPLTIDILDYKGRVCLPLNDTILCENLKSIVYHGHPYLCVQIPTPSDFAGNFMVGDTISLHPGSEITEGSERSVIQEIEGVYILCQDIPNIQEGPYRLLNVSLQNNVILI